jgi:dCTP deaminase
VLGDHVSAFDSVPAGYEGKLYLEVSPRTFPILVRRGSKLAQIRFRRGDARLDAKALAALQARERLVDIENANLSMGAVAVSVDLSGAGSAGLAGFRAKKHTGLIEVDKRGGYEVLDFWEPLPAHKSRALVLDPDAFYILASKEAVHVPPDYAAEMVPFDPLVGEFRVHYAGFFDPGFGHAAAGGKGARAVLEVRSREVPFIIEDSQIVGRLVYERMTERPNTLYGELPGSNYQAQGLKLSKHFKPYQP